MHCYSTILSIVLLCCTLLAVARNATKKCPNGAEFRNCTPICPEPTCDSFDKPRFCFSLRCGAPGCACRSSHVLVDRANAELGCIPIEECP
ncbi:hypothetical protein WR25_26483 [Diploscapter pachys]|uniref:TIL domain-containing protein n=1 Tax=Diploscapter pachys TaxID=2018661 RepID=A0A2A2KS18_9BILA|nr:hypothetical protein WR25_26483 [Diploscapter pachys]